MSLRDEMAGDYEEMVGDDPTTMTVGDVAITGRKSAAMPTSEMMLDAGYDPKANCEFFVLKSQLDSLGVTIPERTKLIEGSTTWTVKGIDDRKNSLAFVYSLKKLA